MIQFNLLPDVKLEYIKAQRSTRLVLSISVLVGVAAIALLLIMLSIDGLQKKHLSDLSKDIKNESAKLQSEPQINKILTVQNQLESLTQLHNSKPAVARMFGYLNELTPNPVSISSMHIDFTANTASITGSADALSSVNQFIDTLKFTTYTATDISSAANGSGSNSSNSSNSSSTANPTTKAFSSVVLGDFGLNNGQNASQQNNKQPAHYTITFSFDPTIFYNTQQVKLFVPSITTTRSQIDKPTDLFTDAPNTGATSKTSSTNTANGGQ